MKDLIKTTIIAVCFVALATPVTAGKRSQKIHIETDPPGALVSVCHGPESLRLSTGLVAGETPTTKEFRFPKKANLWLRFERAGFEPKIVEITLSTTEVSVDLEPVVNCVPREPIRTIALVAPDFTVIKRRFSTEGEDETSATAGAANVVRAVGERLGKTVELVEVGPAEFGRELRSLWREARSSMELIDPIRLPYLADLPTLESRSARNAAGEIAEAKGADAVLMILGKANIETKGMKAGKVGIMVAGTACSYASGYANAMSSGDDFFTYNVFLPSFAEGLALKALLIDTRSFAVRWANKGLWKPIPVDQPEIADAVVADLLADLETQLGLKSLNQPMEEKQ